VARVDESKLSPVELAEARVIHDVRIPQITTATRAATST
jgi:hypothetical protein